VLAATPGADLLQCYVIQCFALLDQAPVQVSAERQHLVPMDGKCVVVKQWIKPQLSGRLHESTMREQLEHSDRQEPNAQR
jgi:hypothetical protein